MGLGDAYFGFLAEAEPGVSHELAFAVGEGFLGVDGGSHAGTEELVDVSGKEGKTDTYLVGVFGDVEVLICDGGRKCGQSLEDVEWVWKCVLSQCCNCQNIEFATRE